MLFCLAFNVRARESRIKFAVELLVFHGRRVNDEGRQKTQQNSECMLKVCGI